MSRIGKAPIDLPSGVSIAFEGEQITVKGPKGTLVRKLRPEITVTLNGNVIEVTRQSDDKLSRSLHGLTRTLVNNMVVGVSTGFEKKLEILGVGYRAQIQGRTVVLQLGFSHPVELTPPEGIDVVVEGNTKLTVKGSDKQLVGDVAAKIRSYRKPEPYKGKGVRYAGEVVRRKAGKAGKK
jgi:large subunit ribosomal protein L6